MFTLKNLRILFSANSIGPRLINTSASKLQSVESKVVPSKEVHIEVPWGHIAGKWYGSENVQPVLMLHGWQDNVGSFDTLIPLLPSDLSYLAFDLPGHGRSSHLPKGCYYHGIDFVPLLEHIRKVYKWERLSLVAHSMGSILSFVYASLYPNNVNLVCALDTLKFQDLEPKITEKIYSHQTKKLISLNEDLVRNPPEYTYDALVQRVHDGSNKSVDLDKAKYLIERGAKASATNPNKFYFTRDIRAKFMRHMYTNQAVSFEYIKRITAPYLFIRGEDRIFAESEANINEGVELFRKHNERFEMIRVKGTHHFHLNQPEIISGPISDFLIKYHPGRTTERWSGNKEQKI
ncbi:probable serine hydrolase [Sitodiplosis mosellana]|uniref:probable serine hydrolase n=1 Tax=Sitodiplosis mosellana TaxID=263140 RepID=UPI002444A830|nr:probable serine hydrolase [Sitodiplosis mosellana]